MEIIRGRKNTIALSIISREGNGIDICCDKTGAPVFVNLDPINREYARLKEKDKKHTMRVVSLL
jgi:hypothetical protein